jgi:DNA-binding FadR family transcriptional regulator
MTNEEKREQIQQALDYMIAEGMVKKVGNGYRLKTERELEEEMNVLYNE